MEHIVDCHSMEDARNKAVQKLSDLMGGGLGPYVKIVVAKNMGGNNPLAGAEVGVEWGKKGRIRLPYNGHNGAGGAWAEISEEEKAAVVEWMARIGARRGPR
jgi:hypothetical protein